MNYVTAIYYPDGFGVGNTPSNRFASRAFTRMFFEKEVPGAISRLESSQAILGDEMIVIIDPRLERDPRTKEAYRKIQYAKLNVREVYEPLPERGFWLKKWHIALQVLANLGDYVWMDFMDTVVKSRLTEQEVGFLKRKEICVEWETFRCFGESFHFSNGRTRKGRVNQPQTSIYYLSSPMVPKLALEQIETDHDQISGAHAFEKMYGIYQDSPKERLLEFSSRGLFKVLPEGKGNLLTGYDNIYHPRIFHKCGY